MAEQEKKTTYNKTNYMKYKKQRQTYYKSYYEDNKENYKARYDKNKDKLRQANKQKAIKNNIIEAVIL